MRLLDLQEEASSDPKAAAAKHVEPYGSQTVAASSLLCGDFNFDVSDPQHALLHGSSRPGLNYRDAWVSAAIPISPISRPAGCTIMFNGKTGRTAGILSSCPRI